MNRYFVFLFFIGFFSQTAVTQTHAPDLTLHGTVTRADFETYKELPFTVPSDVTRISVEYSYTDRDKKTVLDIGLLDPQRFRGWAGGAKSFFTVSESDTTPAFLSGPIVPGVWRILLGIPNIREGVTSSYDIKIWFGHAGDSSTVSTFSREPLRAGPAWFRGDLHMHDAHSDGKCANASGMKVSCPLYQSVEAVAARGLDFISITDHNTTSHFSDMRELQPFFSTLLLIPGREITTFYGHANVWGTTDPIDFRVQHASPAADFNRILDRVAALHAMLSVNHPAQPSGESCMGCGWTVPDTDWSRVSAIEVVNGGNADGILSGIPFWEDKLKLGLRIPAVGGSDNHNGANRPSTIGQPTTVVYAADLSEHAILSAIRAGHVFIDTQGTKTRAMDFYATHTGKERTMMGDNLPHVPADATLHFALVLDAVAGAHARLIVDGNVSPLLKEMPIGSGHAEQEFSYTSDGKRHWLRVEVRDPDGALLLMGNPIYINF